MRSVPLGDLFHVRSSKRVLKAQWKTSGVPYYRGREITRLAANGFVDNELFISEADYAEYATKSGVPVPGDIVITAIGTIGNSYIIQDGDRFYFKDASVLWLKKSNSVSSEFVNLWLQSSLFYDQLDTGNGATVDTLTISKLKKVKISLPPLPEQKRIVEILDEAFAAIDKATTNTEKNIKNAEELFETHLNVAFTLLGKEWAKKKLQAVASILNGYAFKSTDFTTDIGAKCIKITNVGVKKFVCVNDIYLPYTFAVEHDAVKVKTGDIVVALTRTIIKDGLKVAIVPSQYDGALLNQRVASVSTNKEFLSGSFLFYYLSTQEVVDYVTERVNTLMQPNLSIKDLKGMPIPIPPLTTQNELLAQLHSLNTETQNASSVYQNKLTALAELKQSILHRAFTGELTSDFKTVDKALSEAGV